MEPPATKGKPTNDRLMRYHESSRGAQADQEGRLVQNSVQQRPSPVQASDQAWPSDRVRQSEPRYSAWHPEQYSETSGTETMKRYAIVVERAKKNYAAYVPDLPGCVATGDTVEETERLLQEAIELHLAGMREDGLPIPEPSSVVEYVEVSA